MMPELIVWAAILAASLLLLRRFVMVPYKQAQERRRKGLEAAREAKTRAEAELEREKQRRERIRKYEQSADGLLLSVIKAKLELDSILVSVQDFFKMEGVQRLEKWVTRNQDLMKFPPYRSIVVLLEDAKGQVLIKEDIEEALEDFVENAVDYADQAFGIERREIYVDGANEGGRMIETENGSFEYDYTRYDRLLLLVPGADRGWVYVLVNSAMPGLVKIGFTKRNPKGRAASLSRDTGVPTAFTVAFSEIVGNCRRVESITHERLARFRVSPEREFFRVSVDEAVDTIRAVAQDFCRSE